MRRGAAPLVGFTGWGSGASLFRASAFCARPFRAFALILPLERMISHVFPWALT